MESKVSILSLLGEFAKTNMHVSDGNVLETGALWSGCQMLIWDSLSAERVIPRFIPLQVYEFPGIFYIIKIKAKVNISP
jgi:hypothetical protein